MVVLRSHADLPDDCAGRLEAIAAATRGRPSEWEWDYGRYIAELMSFAPPGSIRAGPLYGFPEGGAMDERCVVIGPANADLLEGGLDEWIPDAANGLPMVAALVDGRAASVCASVRASAAAHCAGVETAVAHRGRGLAGLAVAGWAGLVRASGAEPYYATTFDNLASQTVARRLGLDLIGSEFSVRCRTD